MHGRIADPHPCLIAVSCAPLRRSSCFESSSTTANLVCNLSPRQHPTNQAQHNPVVIIPGGPGLPHDYLETLEGAAKDDRLVVLFDPIGTGNSTALPADALEKSPSLLGTASLIAQVT